MNARTRGRESRLPLLALFVVLMASCALRVLLVTSGGQYFWLDENLRFHPCMEIVSGLQNGNLGAVLDLVAQRQRHIGFFLAGTLAAAIYAAISGAPGYTTLWVPALVLSLTSVGSIALVYGLVRRTGGDRVEAVIAALLMACATTMFYYARHLLPYDTSLALVLLALWIGLGGSSMRRSFVVGVVGSLAFLTYYGYLTIVLVAIAVHVLRERNLGRVVARGGAVALGMAVVPALIHAVTLARGATPFAIGAMHLMTEATQGSYAEGWRIPWVYLWHAEHGLLVAWIVGVGAIVVSALTRGPAFTARGLLWTGMAAAIYLLLTVNSTVLHESVVFGRFARQLVPFLSLATAFAVRQWAARVNAGGTRAGRLVWTAALLALVGQTAINFAPPFRQWFPAEVEAEVMAAYGGNVARDFGVQVNDWGSTVDRPSRYILLNVGFLYPAAGIAPQLAYGEVILRRRHPLEFKPYQYEAFGPVQRAVLREADISMRLIDTASPRRMRPLQLSGLHQGRS